MQALLRHARRNLVAYLALFVALSSSAYAGSSKLLPRNSVGSAQVINRSLQAQDLSAKARRALHGVRGARGLRGLRGPRGASGPQGLVGNKGDPGRSALSQLQSGETIRGVWGHAETGSMVGQPDGSFQTLPIPAPVVLDNAHVTVDGTADEVGNVCTGSYADPMAPPGYVCAYPNVADNVSNLAGFVPGSQATKYGFLVEWFSTISSGLQFGALGSWAYTAP